jgi:acetylglutamate kinase
MDKLIIVKVGGNIIDDEIKLKAFLKDFAGISSKKILVHGGGKLATRLAEQLQIPQNLVDGRRITDAETLRIITMVYAGYINKNIVAGLQAGDCNAIGLTGADANSIFAHKRLHSSIDYGFAGDVDEINVPFFRSLLDRELCPVIAPVTHDGKGQLLNTNADTISQEIANKLATHYELTLVYTFEKDGVMLDLNDDNSLVKKLNGTYYSELKTKGIIFAGMIPKLDNAFRALEAGVKKVIVGKAEDILKLVDGTKGTCIINE